MSLQQQHLAVKVEIRPVVVVLFEGMLSTTPNFSTKLTCEEKTIDLH